MSSILKPLFKTTGHQAKMLVEETVKDMLRDRVKEYVDDISEILKPPKPAFFRAPPNKTDDKNKSS